MSTARLPTGFNIAALLLWLPMLWLLSACAPPSEGRPKQATRPAVRGWNLLSNDVNKGEMAIATGRDYAINHLQLSHHLLMDLKHVREPERLAKTRQLIAAAREAGIEKVLVWDHALYNLSYYPDTFKTTAGLINLDNPAFWSWVKDDYRSMLDSLPDLDGIVLTFIETGAHIEDQYSEKWPTESEKLARLVDTLASLFIDERGLDLFVRTFMYHQAELDAMLGCLGLIRHPGVKVMTKETPHDFFLTHPVSRFVRNIDKEVLIEFDLGHEYNGQGVIASILPEITARRWRYYAGLPNVIGYVARTDRYGDTQNIGRPTEVNLYTLHQMGKDTSLAVRDVVADFIRQKYGAKALPHLLPVFLETEEIIGSVFYTLGLHMNSHSRMNFEHQSNYSRHCSGKWLDPPLATIGHDLDTTMHYWKEVVEYLAPPRFKARYLDQGRPTILFEEVPWVIDSGWVSPVDRMNEEYLRLVVREKAFGLSKARWALDQVKAAEADMAHPEDYLELLHLYERTWLTARLYLAASKSYFGHRTLRQMPANAYVRNTLTEGRKEMMAVSSAMKEYPFPGPSGQYSWLGDLEYVERLYRETIP